VGSEISYLLPNGRTLVWRIKRDKYNVGADRTMNGLTAEIERPKLSDLSNYSVTTYTTSSVSATEFDLDQYHIACVKDLSAARDASLVIRISAIDRVSDREIDPKRMRAVFGDSEVDDSKLSRDMTLSAVQDVIVQRFHCPVRAEMSGSILQLDLPDRWRDQSSQQRESDLGAIVTFVAGHLRQIESMTEIRLNVFRTGNAPQSYVAKKGADGWGRLSSTKRDTPKGFAKRDRTGSACLWRDSRFSCRRAALIEGSTLAERDVGSHEQVPRNR
jgi:hypothetical protein